MRIRGWRTILGRLKGRIWFRLALFATVALALALVARWIGPLLPSGYTPDLGQDSVRTILQILASSMLVVTTFSLTVMVSAYASAAAVGTPRATQLLIQDQTSQNALSSFLGSFVFAIVGIAALSTGYYGDQGRIILYFGTLVVIAIVVITLLSWIHHLTGFGRPSDVIDRVERAATDAAVEFARQPYLGGAPEVAASAGLAPGDVASADVALPSLVPVVADRVGILTGIGIAELSEAAAEHGLKVHVRVLPGAAVNLGTTLAEVEGDVQEGTVGRMRRAFRLENHRTFEQDPRLGFIALSEIASRALSAAVNDPGTAIEVLNALQRVATRMLTTPQDSGVDHPSVHVQRVGFAEMLEDGFRPIARDGAGMVEVGLRLQRVLGALTVVAKDADVDAVRAASLVAERRAVAALTDPQDLELIRAAGSAARA